MVPPASPVPNPLPPGNTDHGIDSSVPSVIELPSVVFSAISSGLSLASVVVSMAVSLSATVFAPETIGAFTYIVRNLDRLTSRVVAAINLTCIGDDGDYSFLASRTGVTPMDRIGRRVVRTREPAVEYSYLNRGSDERHYGMPGVDVPMISLMRTKYGAYSEYHTHLDDLTVVTPSGLQGGLDLVRDCLIELESTDYYRSTVLAEPQLGRRGLYHTMHARTVADEILLRTNVLAYADGEHSLADMADLFGMPVDDVRIIVNELIEHDLLTPGPLRKASS